MKKILLICLHCVALVLAFFSFQTFAQMPAQTIPQVDSKVDSEGLSKSQSLELAPTGQLRNIAQTTTNFVPRSLVAEEGLLVVQTSFYLPDRKRTSDRKVFTLNQSNEESPQ
ncbi:MAG: hypothetical protein ACK5WZ_00705 [Pseudobdellovibrionaceae bacterium]|jgi:hypothetical protein